MKWFRKKVKPYDINSSLPPTLEQIELVIKQAEKQVALSRKHPHKTISDMHLALARSLVNEARILQQMYELAVDNDLPLR